MQKVDTPQTDTTLIIGVMKAFFNFLSMTDNAVNVVVIMHVYHIALIQKQLLQVRERAREVEQRLTRENQQLTREKEQVYN